MKKQCLILVVASLTFFVALPAAFSEMHEADHYYRAGRVAMARFRKRDAQRNFLRCVSIDNKYAQCHKYLGILYARRGRQSLACFRFRKYLSLSPNGAESATIRRLVKHSCSP